MIACKKILLLLVFGILCFNSHAQIASLPWKTIYLVRHAEKEKGPDPLLSSSGLQRAGDLYRLLKNKKIDVIYSTPYRRTRMTGDSIRIYLGVDTATYMTDTTGAGLEQAMLRYHGRQKNILIIGHSNTIGVLLRKFGAADDSFKDLPDDAYDNIYILHRRKGKIVMEHKKYGKATGASGGMMKAL